MNIVNVKSPKMLLGDAINFSKMSDEDKKIIISDLNIKIGADINELACAYEVETELVERRNHLQSCLNAANSEVPTKLTTAIKKAEENSKEIDRLKALREDLREKVKKFKDKTDPLRKELEKRFAAIHKLEATLRYIQSFEKIEDLSQQLKQTNDDEQAVQLYGELKELCAQYSKGHRTVYIKEYIHYWHNVLKDKLTKHYEEVLKLLKWPFTTGSENSPPPKEILLKFSNITKFLFRIQEPEDLITSTVTNEFLQEQDPCLPVRILLRPLKKRFTFHFTGSRQTARIDRPEWFLTQTLTWIKDHQSFVRTHVQPVADKLQMKNVKAVEEFNAGLISLAAERLHTVLALYHSQGSKGEAIGVDAAFAHAVDETLGFHKELVTITGKEADSVLSVLTRAETFVRWLAVEKKYALAKMDEALSSEQWSEPVGVDVGAAVGAARWVPRAAHWLVALLSTIEQRYSMLPQPGHRLQFLELQLELVEEWRVRLTQLLGAATAEQELDANAPPRALTAVVNAAHHTRAVLLQWAHSLHYLQLHYYRRQFQHFTHRQHTEESETLSTTSDSSILDTGEDLTNSDAVSLKEVEARAKKMALNEVTRRDSMLEPDLYSSFDIESPIANLRLAEPLVDEDTESAGVWCEAPALLAHLRDAGLAALTDAILLEFKASMREYKKQKWHSMPVCEERALCVSGALCGPLAALCGRRARAAGLLAPPLAQRFAAHLARAVDDTLFAEVVLENWFNTGGTAQLTHDVTRNLVPALAPHCKSVKEVCPLPKLLESCKLLNLDYDDGRRLRAVLEKQPTAAGDALETYSIRHVLPAQAIQILNQRTDLSESPTSVLELF